MLSSNITTENIVEIYEPASEVETLYEWSDDSTLVADIYMSQVRQNGPLFSGYKNFDVSSIPDGTTLYVEQYRYDGSKNFHFVYENNELHMYQSASADTYTATSYYNITKYNNNSSPVSWCNTNTYWSDNEMFFYYEGDSSIIKYFNTDVCYKNGWHKAESHKVDKKVFYKDYSYFDSDYNVLIKHYRYPLNEVGVKINPQYSWSNATTVYSPSTTGIGPIYAPTTTGSTGQVVVMGSNGYTPEWANPESLTNGIKFWKGTQAEYEAITTKDSSTLYIIVPDE